MQLKTIDYNLKLYMDKNGLIKFSNTAVVTDESQYSGVRAKSFKVKTTAHDFVQYVRTVKAYALAGMPFADIANAGDLLGDEVERIAVMRLLLFLRVQSLQNLLRKER